jgi:class 3 adenylate cyclase
VSLTLLVFPLFMHHSTETVPFVPFVFLAGAGGLTGALGALVAQKRKPREVNPAEEETAAASHGPMNRAALLDQMFALQRQLTEQKRRAAFLSVDVVGSSAIKQAALTTGDELAVEHAFVQYHRWVEQVVCAHGGRVHATAGDGVMCLVRRHRRPLRRVA